MNTDEVVKKITQETGRRITQAKQQAGITNTQLAETLGLTRTTLARKLDGHRQFTITELNTAAHALTVPLESLLPTPMEVTT